MRSGVELAASQPASLTLSVPARGALSASPLAAKLPSLLRNPPGILEACDDDDDDDETGEPSANLH